jgi:hypothetical protein
LSWSWPASPSPLAGDGVQYCHQPELSIKLPLIFSVKHLVSSTAKTPMAGGGWSKMQRAEYFDRTTFNAGLGFALFDNDGI